MKKKQRSEKAHAEAKKIYLVGEHTEHLLIRIAEASLAKFGEMEVLVRSFTVENEERIQEILEYAKKEEALVAFSVVEPNLRDTLLQGAEILGVEVVDVVGDFIGRLTGFLEKEPIQIPGLQYAKEMPHVLDEEYYRRIEAINFAVKHDDGKNPRALELADLVIIGLSRSGKTPVSVSLAHHGWKVANIPLHPDMEVPLELFEVKAEKVFGLILDVETLVNVREARLEQLGLSTGAKYADPVKIADEIEWCEKFYQKHPQWQIVNTSRAIEDVVAEIVSLYSKS